MDQDSSQIEVTLRRLVNGYQTTQAIHVAAKLGIADLLADGPRTSDDLAVATATHAPSLYRLMRALAAVDILREEDGVLFDQPHVVSGAPALVQDAGVLDCCEIAGGSFFEAVPGGGDAYVLKSILHDREDEQCLEILRVCRRAMAGGAALLVVERQLGPANEQPEAKFSDLNMLVSPGGRERTTDEYAALFEASGFRFEGVTPSASGMSVFEGAVA
ncbi:hypothetical protein BH24CHL4_BH24CHL4_27550 [soil metagenome]